MLELRPNCEHCDRDLPGDSERAWICSFECTFCAQCAHECCAGTCPNCAGELVRRPRRSPAKLQRHPASTTRAHRSVGAGDVARPSAPSARIPAPESAPEATQATAEAAALTTCGTTIGKAR